MSGPARATSRRVERALRRSLKLSFWRELSSGRVLKPAYFSLILRWCTWLIALVVSMLGVLVPANQRLAPQMLLFTGLWLALQTLYLPVIRSGLPAVVRRSKVIRVVEHGALLCTIEVLLAGLVMGLTGGWGSPFYLFGLSSVVMPALLFGFRAGLLAGIGFSLLYVLAVLANPVGWARVNQPGALDGFIQYSIVGIPFALFAAYLGQVLRSLTAEAERTRRALTDERILRTVTASGLQHVADPTRFVAATVAAVGRRRALTSLAVIYRPPVTERDRVTGRQVAWTGRGFGPVERVMAQQIADLGHSHDSVMAEQAADPGDPRDRRWRSIELASASRSLGWLLVDAAEAGQRQSFLALLAGQISTALDNAHLYAEAERLAAQAERARLAREIHDGIAQSLFMLTLNLEACAELVERDPQRLRGRLATLIDLSRQTLWQTRHYVHDLKPLLADEQSLTAVVQNQVKEFQTISGLPVELTITGQEGRQTPAVKQALYRIAQEGLANVFKHSGAAQIEVVLAFTAAATVLTIIDDGRGFALTEVDQPGRRGFGLGNMRERADELGGRLTITSYPTQGTRIEVWMPPGDGATEIDTMPPPATDLPTPPVAGSSPGSSDRGSASP